MDWKKGVVMNYQTYLSYMEHLNFEGSKYRVLTEEEFMVVMDWIGFVQAREQFQKENSDV